MTPDDARAREREAREADVDGAYEAFRERVRWFYRNAPECQEARKHSFSRQGDMAFTLALNERMAAVRAATLAAVRPALGELRNIVESAERGEMCCIDSTGIARLRPILDAALDALAGEG